ncbi:MAG: hypothetical protein ACRDHP_20160, partial [Ktedonobacterales bacterium]
MATRSFFGRDKCAGEIPMLSMSTWRRDTRRRGPLGVVTIGAMLLAILLAGCGGSTGAHHASATPTATATPAPKGWSVIPSPGVGEEGTLLAVTTLSATSGWAAGQYEGLDSLQRTLTERWDGTQWAYQPSPSPGVEDNVLQAVSGSAAGDVWAAGFQTGASGGESPLIEHWNGSAWSVIPTPKLEAGTSSAALSGVAAISASDAWAVGDVTMIAAPGQGASQQTLIEHWNGSAWSSVNGATLPPPQNNASPQAGLAAVTAISANNV